MPYRSNSVSVADDATLCLWYLEDALAQCCQLAEHVPKWAVLRSLITEVCIEEGGRLAVVVPSHQAAEALRGFIGRALPEAAPRREARPRPVAGDRGL